MSSYMNAAKESFASDFSSAALFTAISIAIASIYILYVREGTPLRSIPGPFLASITRIWIFQQQRGFQRQQVDIDLHQKYGPIVRIAPNEVLVSSPQSFKTIYGAGSKFSKGDWYFGTSDAGWNGDDTLDFLSEVNMEKYRLQRRLVGPAYSVDSIKDLEPNLDKILEKNIDIMRERSGQPMDIDIFFNYFTSDCLQMLTFGHSKGFVEADEEDGSIKGIHSAWLYMHLVGFFPLLHKATTWFIKTCVKYFREDLPVLITVRSKEGRRAKKESVFEYVIKEVQARAENPNPPPQPTDIMGKLFQIRAEKPALKQHWLNNMCLTNFGAGVETTAITISALINSVISHPGCQERIQTEIDEARKARKLGKIPKLRELKESLPYLNACINESARMHPVVGMPLVRVVPEGGREIEGYFLPAGTTVGINPWVLARDKSLYGEDGDQWRPERWLEFNDSQLKRIDTYSTTFGTGARSCPGKHLAQAIYEKAIPMLFMNFDWSYVDPKVEPVTRCTFSVRFMKLMIQWKVRENID